MKYPKEEMETAYQQLVQREKPLYTFLGALAGLPPAAAFYLLLGTGGWVLIVMLLVPPAIIGLFARYIGSPFRLKPRVPVGIIAFVLHLVGCYFLGLSLSYLLAPVAGIVAVTLSRVRLNDLEKFAIGHAELGNIKV